MVLKVTQKTVIRDFNGGVRYVQNNNKDVRETQFTVTPPPAFRDSDEDVYAKPRRKQVAGDGNRSSGHPEPTPTNSNQPTHSRNHSADMLLESSTAAPADNRPRDKALLDGRPANESTDAASVDMDWLNDGKDDNQLHGQYSSGMTTF